jgi:hypothetical protein
MSPRKKEPCDAEATETALPKKKTTRSKPKAAELSFVFNFKTIKELAKPGSWRRGYGYFKAEGQVLSIELTKQGVLGRVKGNFKDAYQTNLIFKKKEVLAECDCPLEEPWCKHAVAVALHSVLRHDYETFFKIAFEAPQRVSTVASSKDHAGRFRVLFSWQERHRYLSIKLQDRQKPEAEQDVLALAPVLKSVMTLQKEGRADFSDAEKQEYRLIQYLYKSGLTVAQNGWYPVGIKDFSTLLEFIQPLEELVHAETLMRMRFESQPLYLVMSVNASLVGNVLVSFHWHRRHWPADVFPLEEVHLFGRDIAWGVYQDCFYPLAHVTRPLPHYLSRTSFFDVRDADGGKFVFEELPSIRDHVEVEQSEMIDKATLEQEPPIRIVELKPMESGQEEGYRIELYFQYDKARVAYSKGHDAPYVTVTDAENDQIYWLRRQKKLEEQSFKLLDKATTYLQSNIFQAVGDQAIEFALLLKNKLKAEGWIVQSDLDINALQIAEAPLKIVASLKFADDSVDQFTMRVSGAVGEARIDIDTVQQELMLGKKYLWVEGAGYVEIPLAEILMFTKTLQAFNKEDLGEDTYLIKTYQAGLVSELIELGVQTEMSPRFQKFWNLITAFNQLEDVDVPAEVQAELRPYQKHGFNWLWFLYTYGLNGILADDMGLGKTLQTLVTLKKAKDQDGQMPSLIVCPTSVVFNWQKETEKFTPDLSVMNLTGSDRLRQLKTIPKTDIIITSYALLRRDYKILRQLPFRYIILDESQNIKNIETQTAQASKELNAQHRLALSGTPVENRLTELWSAFDFLMPGLLMDLEEFKYQYVTPIEERGNQDAERRLKKQISPFILRRLKRDVAKDLPDKVENIKYCELLPEQQTLYMDILEKTREEMNSKMTAQGGVNQSMMLSALLRLRQVCCHPDLLKSSFAHEGVGSGKFLELQEMLLDIIDEGHRVLLFSQFVEMLDIVKQWLESRGIRHEYLTGQTQDRQARVERFNQDSSIPVFLISLKAGGTGLNLTGADYVIHYDPWWNPAAEEQATDRAHRIGQTKTVFVYRFIARGTVEEKIMRLKEKKQNLVDSVISVDRDLAKKISFEDLKDIMTPTF